MALREYLGGLGGGGLEHEADPDTCDAAAARSSRRFSAEYYLALLTIKIALTVTLSNVTV